MKMKVKQFKAKTNLKKPKKTSIKKVGVKRFQVAPKVSSPVKMAVEEPKEEDEFEHNDEEFSVGEEESSVGDEEFNVGDEEFSVGDEEFSGGDEEFNVGDEDDDEDEDEDSPAEEPVEKDEPTIPSKVKSGQIPADFPYNQIVHVNKLPKKTKLIDVVGIFAKYGAIDTIHIHEGPLHSTANVAFKTPTAATASLAANKHEIKGSKISVTMKRIPLKKQQSKLEISEGRERSVYARNLKRGTDVDELREYFSSCGEVESVRVVDRNSLCYGFVTFVEKATVQKALSLHNTVFKGNTIGVFENKMEASANYSKRNPKFTIMLKNKQGLECVEGQTFQSIFAKCGEIECIDVVCRKYTLAFITFKSEEAVEKAFKLNGKKVQGIELDIEAYNPERPKTTIFVTNIAKDVTEEDIKSHFSRAGDVSAVTLRKGFAIVHFKDPEGYCKSFLLNETILKGRMVFLEPHSLKKQALLKSKTRSTGKKRPAHNRNVVFAPKRFKAN